MDRNHTPCYYFISSSDVFILGNTMNQTDWNYCFLFCAFLSSIWKMPSVYLQPFCEWDNNQKGSLAPLKESFRVKSRNLNAVSTFCCLYLTWYVMLSLFYVDFVNSHQSEEFLLLLPPTNFSAASRLGCAWIQTAAFTTHYTAALLGEGEFRRALTPKVLNTSHSSSGRGKKESFFSGYFLFVCFCFFGSWKGWQRTVIVQAVRIFL